jgi:hypothetical protein
LICINAAANANLTIVDERCEKRRPMPPKRNRQVPPPLHNQPRSLGEACRELGLDSYGMRCPACPLKVLCMTESRWRVPRLQRPRNLV